MCGQLILFIHQFPPIPPVCQLRQDVFEPWPGGVHVEVRVAGAFHVAAELLQVVELGGDDHPPRGGQFQLVLQTIHRFQITEKALALLGPSLG